MQALAEGALNHCKDLNLSGNDSITASGFRYLSTSLQSNSCRLEKLCLGAMNIGDDGVEVLVRGLIGNKVLRCLELRDDEGDIAITTVGWYALSTALCDTSTVNNTYLSNHTVHFEEPYEDEDIDESVVLYLQLNEKHPQYAAGCKILMNHAHLDMAPLLQWELKFLPLAVRWFEGAKSCTTLSIDEYNYTDYRRRVLEESEEAFQSRILTALYEFVRGVTEKVLERRDELALVAACDDKIARLREDLEQRDRNITHLKKRTRGMSWLWRRRMSIILRWSRKKIRGSAMKRRGSVKMWKNAIERLRSSKKRTNDFRGCRMQTQSHRMGIRKMKRQDEDDGGVGKGDEDNVDDDDEEEED
eukprot:scaffold8567_cov83-Skeletonema_marinoi.AAC.2